MPSMNHTTEPYALLSQRKYIAENSKPRSTIAASPQNTQIDQTDLRHTSVPAARRNISQDHRTATQQVAVCSRAIGELRQWFLSVAVSWATGGGQSEKFCRR
jgi:hypothetical protein